jgi:DNA-binding GntR family transcriptional regulator
MDAEKRRKRSKKFLREQVYQNLKNSIITGEHEPDGRLIEEDLAAKTGTSRTPVREALQKLEKEGLIYRRDRKSVV